MLSPLPPRLQLLTLLLAGSVAGCHSVRPAFQFRPVTPLLAAATARPVPAETPVGPPSAAPEGAARAIVVKPEPQRPHALRQPKPHQAKKLASQPQPPASIVAAHPTGRQALQAKRLLVRPRAAQPAAAVAENGLGTMFVGILGIVALLVGLIGLLLSGGGFFGALAVVGAVALLISIFLPILRGYGG